MRRLWGVALATLGFFGGRAAQDEGHWLARNGADWSRLSPEAKRAYTEGFLAGGALAQAAESGAADSAGLEAGLAALKRNTGFRFPYGANVYGTRLEDYYWWDNHRLNRLWYAFWEVNTELKRSGQSHH